MLTFHRTEFLPEERQKMHTIPGYAHQDPYRVAPHVWMVSGHCDQSDFLLDTGEGLILIDTPVAEYEQYLLDSIRKTGHHPEDIKLLLLSHEHFDHVGCAATIQKLSGCHTYMSKISWDAIQNPAPLPVMKEGAPKHMELKPFTVDEFYDDKKNISLGRFTISTLLTPGHTSGVTSFFFDDTDEETNVTYHVAMHGGLGIDSMRPGVCGVKPWGVPESDRDKFIDQCWELSLRDVDITLASHSNQANINENIPSDRNDYTAFVDDRAWPVMLLERRSRAMEFRCGGNTYYGYEKKMF